MIGCMYGRGVYRGREGGWMGRAGRGKGLQELCVHTDIPSV